MEVKLLVLCSKEATKKYYEDHYMGSKARHLGNITCPLILIAVIKVHLFKTKTGVILPLDFYAVIKEAIQKTN